MTTLTLKKDPTAKRVETTDTHLVVHLNDGRAVSAPLEWFPRLAFGMPSERANCQIYAGGAALEWPALDEHIRVETLLEGERSEESAAHLKRWKQAMRRRRRDPEPEPWGVGSYQPPYDEPA